MIKDNKISDIYTMATIMDDFLLVELDIESKNPKELIPLIKKYYDEYKITEEDLERYKKVRISKEVRRLEYVTSAVLGLKKDIINYGDVLFNKIDLIKAISLDKVKKVKKELDFDNVSIVIGNTKSK